MSPADQTVSALPQLQVPKRIIDLPPSYASKVDAIAHRILSAPDVAAVRIIYPPHVARKGPSTVFYFARAADIRAILADDRIYTLHPYDVALSAAAGDVRFILGSESDALKDRRAMLVKVIGKAGSTEYDAITERVRAAARAAATEFTAQLRSRPPHRLTFNIIREYGYLIPYLTAARVIGVTGPKRSSFLVRTFLLFRNVFGARHWLYLGPEQKRCQTVVTWSHLIFGHIFTNFENRNGVLLALARSASQQFNAHIEELITKNLPDFDQTLLSEFLLKRSFFPHIQLPAYRAYVRSILFELTGAMTLLVAVSFGRILDTLVKRGASLPAFLAGVRGEDGESLIDEVLRMNSTTSFLFRRVAKRTELANVELNPGDHVCVLVGPCGKADGPFRDPPPAHAAHLNFGLPGGPHTCFGQKWGRVILQEMFGALADVERLRPADGVSGVREFQGLPDELEMVLAPPPPT
jgi:cytochrome P450